MSDNIVNPVLPTGLRCVNKILNGRHGAGLIAHAQDVGCGDDTPGSIGSRAPAVIVRRLFLHSSFQGRSLRNDHVCKHLQ